jgi:signal peptidase II
VQERRAVAALTATGGTRRRYLIVAAVGLVAVALDQLTKSWAERVLAERTIHVVWTLRLNLSFNSGIAFGLARGLGPILVAVAVAVFVVLLTVNRSVTSNARAVAVGLVLGGASGNLIDRLVRGNGGAVIDFIDLQWWPVFNVADMAVSCGAILLVITASRPQPEQ